MNVFDDLKKYWGVVAQAGLWVMNIVAGFVLPPTLGVPAEEQAILSLAQFIVNILLGLILVLTIKFQKKSHWRWWFGACMLSLVLAVIAYFAYMQRRNVCTCEYYSTIVLIGTEPRNEAWRNVPCSLLIRQATGNAYDVWTAESIHSCRICLGVNYIVTVPLFVIGLITMLQAIYITEKHKPRRRKPNPRPPKQVETNVSVNDAVIPPVKSDSEVSSH